jgi:hypothetical protein
MFKKDILSIVVVSIYLVIYCVLLQSESTETLAVSMWALSPFLITWMAYMVIRYGKYEGKELGSKEWGYGDVD